MTAHIRNLLNEYSRWSKLRGFGQSYLVRASILMPAFGYILLLNEQLQQLLTKIKFDNWLLEHLPPWILNWLLKHFPSWPSTWRIWFLFFGTSCLAIASILFSLFCPTEIKQYGSAFQMASAERHHIVYQGLIGSLRQTLKSLYAGMSKREASLLRVPVDPDNPTVPSGAPSQDSESSLLIAIWEFMDIRQPKLRTTICLLLGVGLLLVGIPAVYTFINVLLVALSKAIRVFA